MHPVQLAVPVQEVHGDVQGSHWLTFIYSEEDVQWHWNEVKAIFAGWTQLSQWVDEPEQLAQGSVQSKHEFPLRYFVGMHPVQLVAVPVQDVHGDVQGSH